MHAPSFDLRATNPKARSDSLPGHPLCVRAPDPLIVYELGTWSTSGVKFGVRVDKAGGGVTYFTNLTVAAW